MRHVCMTSVIEGGDWTLTAVTNDWSGRVSRVNVTRMTRSDMTLNDLETRESAFADQRVCACADPTRASAG